MSEFDNFDEFQHDEFEDFDQYEKDSQRILKFKNHLKKKKPNKDSFKKLKLVAVSVIPIILIYIIIIHKVHVLPCIFTNSKAEFCDLSSISTELKLLEVRNLVRDRKIAIYKNHSSIPTELISIHGFKYFQNLYDQLYFEDNDDINNLQDFIDQLVYDKSFAEAVYNHSDAKDRYSHDHLFYSANFDNYINTSDVLHFDPMIENLFSQDIWFKRVLLRTAPYKSAGKYDLKRRFDNLFGKMSFIDVAREKYKGTLAIIVNPSDNDELVFVFPDGQYTRSRDDWLSERFCWRCKLY